MKKSNKLYIILLKIFGILLGFIISIILLTLLEKYIDSFFVSLFFWIVGAGAFALSLFYLGELLHLKQIPRKILLILFVLMVTSFILIVIFLPTKTIMSNIEQIESEDNGLKYSYIITYSEINPYFNKPMSWHKTWKEEVMEVEK
ncbi:hypothetical protein CMO93_03760 [Candidatus Woesearchaeota archaeon]|nr:hypothetical protein [Candidatus Woesearchaeota archaeon]